jgi:hypothetical protein
MRNAVLASVVAVLIAACGGSSATPAPQSSSRSQATTAAQAGEPIDTAAVQAAVTALKAHDSWQFSVTLIRSGTPNTSQTITGTQRTAPQPAVSAAQPVEGSNDFHYIRIGDDIWYDVGQPTYTHIAAADAKNLIAQYEPYYLDGLVQSALANGYEFDPVADETVSGVLTTHYRLESSDVDQIVESMKGITAADWAADVWIAKADGSLMRLAWGPQSVDKAQLQPGFNYVVTALDCSCPVDPPTNVSPAE